MADNNLTDGEMDDFRQRAFLMPDDEIAELLEELAKRELGLLESDSIQQNEDFRQRVLNNAAALTAAAERFHPKGWNINQVQTEKPGTETSEDEL
jgi:hypothetical protein